MSAKVFVVSGCMGSGKTTYVKTHRANGDLVVDFDYIIQAISLRDIHEHDMSLFDIAIIVRDFLYDIIESDIAGFQKAWIITTLQGSRLDELLSRYNAEHIEILADMDTCIKRVLTDASRKDKSDAIKQIKKYFNYHERNRDIFDVDNRYNTAPWKHLRLAVLKRDSYMCQECKRKGLSKEADTVHHIEPGVADLFYDASNLISLCSACHNNMHNRMTGELTTEGKKWVRRRRLGLVSGIRLI